MLDHMDFSDSDITGQTIQSLSHLKHLEIKECRGKLKFEFPEKNGTNFDSLESIDIEECELSEIPNELLAKAPNLKKLSLFGNQITKLRKGDFTTTKKVSSINLKTFFSTLNLKFSWKH